MSTDLILQNEIVGLLKEALERISSLQNFYKTQKRAIDAAAKAGMDRNRLGFEIDLYCNILVGDYDEAKKDKDFCKFEEKILSQVEIIESNSENGRGHVSFRYRDLEALVAQKIDLNVKTATAAFKQFADMPIIHGDNALIMLITRFEEFLSSFFTMLYFMYPQKYLDTQQIAFSEIIDKGIDEVRDTIVSREIESLMRKSYTEWFDLLKTHGILLANCQDEIDLLKEAYARRNILVHNAGVVNSSYLKNVLSSSAKVGDKLNASEAYLDRAFSAVQIIIFTIHIEAAKLIKDKAVDYISKVFDTAFDWLQKGEYHLSKSVFKSIYTSKYADSITRQMAQVNYWIAKSEEDGVESIKEDVAAFDVLSLQSIFSVAKELLLQNFDKADTLIEELYKKEDIYSYMIEEWPLFKNYRATEYYADFKEKHAAGFAIATAETHSGELTDTIADDICDSKEQDLDA